MPEPGPDDLQPTLEVAPNALAKGAPAAETAASLAVSLHNLLGQFGNAKCSSLLPLLRADQRKRWHRGDRLLSEVYFANVPALASEEEAALDLIYSEIVLREELGEKPAVEEYVQRFPQYAKPLRRQFLLNQALGSSSLLDMSGAATADISHTPGAQPRAPADSDGGTVDWVKIPKQETTEEPAKPIPGGSEVTLEGGPPVPMNDTLARKPQLVSKNEPAPPEVPGYEIREVLGRGGMGVVYKAVQLKLKRLVALKMILAGAHASPQELARLRSEAEAVARLKHQYIVQILDVGDQNGLPFLSLEFVEGGSLADKIKGTPLPNYEAARVVEQLAEAMNYAHEQGIVHRDLKPANILLSPTVGSKNEMRLSTPSFSLIDLDAPRPVQTGYNPKITDFGLAKITEGESHITRSGAIVGTPSYMSPEQAAGQTDQIGPSADIYSLGAILYELLTGRPPFRAASAVDTILQVMSEEPVPPVRLQPKVSRDLETICLKCLEKQPARRYANALALAEDLCAYREGRPITARPVPLWERGVKWAKRRPQIAALLGLVIFVSVVGFALVTWQWRRAVTAREYADNQRHEAEAARAKEEAQRKEKEHALADARLNLYFNRVALAEREWSANDVIGVLKLLDNAPTELRSWEWNYLRRLCRGGQMTLAGQGCVAISPDDRAIASAEGAFIKLWDFSNGRELLRFDGKGGRVNHVAFSLVGDRLASAHDDGAARIWDARTGKLLLELGKANKASETLPAARAVAFSPDGKFLASAHDDDNVKLWNAVTGKLARTLTGHTDNVTCVAFSPDGKLLASGSEDQTVKLWEPETGKEVQTLRGHEAVVRCVAFAPKGSLLASGGDDKMVKLWDPNKGTELRTLLGNTSAINALAFSNEGKLAVATGDFLKAGELKIWDPLTARDLQSFRWPTQDVTGVAFSADGKRLASADKKAVIVWDATNDLESRALRGHTETVMSVAFAPPGNILVSAGEDERAKIWGVQTEKVLAECFGHTAPINAVVCSPDGKRIATASDDKTVKLWDAETGRLLATFPGHTTGVLSVAFSPDGKFLASAACVPDRMAGEVKLWNIETGKEVWAIPNSWVRILAFSSDGKTIAAGADKHFQVFLLDALTGKELHSLPGFRQPISCVAFSADGKWLAASGGSKEEGIIKVWNAATLEELRTIKTRTGRIATFAFSPDGQRIIGASWDHTLKLFDTATGQDVLTLRGHTDGVMGVAFSPDGKRIASASKDRTVKLWDARPIPGEAKDANAK